LLQLQTETGFRESFRIFGETVVTASNDTSGRLFDDAKRSIAWCYPPYVPDRAIK